MNSVNQLFSARRREIYGYLQTLKFLDERGRRITTRTGDAAMDIDLTTRHVLKASVFVHLYNLIESTVSLSMSTIADGIAAEGATYGDLREEWRRAWVKSVGRTDEALGAEKRLEAVLDLCEGIQSDKVVSFSPKHRSNLDDEGIEKILARHGLNLHLSASLRRAVKQPVENNDGPLRMIRKRRNELAHGRRSFRDCGESVTVRDLRVWSAIVFAYLRAVLRAFEDHVTSRGYLAAVP